MQNQQLCFFCVLLFIAFEIHEGNGNLCANEARHEAVTSTNSPEIIGRKCFQPVQTMPWSTFFFREVKPLQVYRITSPGCAPSPQGCCPSRMSGHIRTRV